MIPLHLGYRVRTGPGKPGISLWHFPGLESPGKMALVLESSGNLLNSTKKYQVYGRLPTIKYKKLIQDIKTRLTLSKEIIKLSVELNKIDQINSIYFALENFLIYQYHQFPRRLTVASETSYTYFLQ